MKKIVVNANPWQKRVAVLNNGKLQDLGLESTASERLEKAFFKGKVATVLPGIQTAFVDIGQERAGFLHISEVDRDLAYGISDSDDVDQLEEIKSGGSSNKRPSGRPGIQGIFNEGDEVLVQVNKEPVMGKGAKLTTCYTLAGRFVVLMPNVPRIGISKKIDSREERGKLRDLLLSSLPEGMGAIVRTTADLSKAKEIARDIKLLKAVWDDIQAKYKTAKPGDLIYEDVGVLGQIPRDHLDDAVEAVVVDNSEVEEELRVIIKKMAPEYVNRLQSYSGTVPIFEFYDIETQIDEALNRKVILKSGGSIVIETTEAMTVVDVNTGRFTGKKDLEDTIFKTNVEASEEIVRQLRLRNIGGLIVIDFIDMEIGANRQKLVRHFEKCIKENDRFQSVILKISEFGLVQMTRKRTGKTLSGQLMEMCQVCGGTGRVKSLSTICYEILRTLKRTLADDSSVKAIVLKLDPEIFDYISTVEYNAVIALEKKSHSSITIESASEFGFGDFKIIAS